MFKYIKASLFVVLLFLIMVVPCFASYSYYIPIAIYNNGTTTYTNYPILVPINNSQLASNGYIDANGLSTAFGLIGNDYQLGVFTAKLGFFIDNLYSGRTTNFNYWLNWAPARTQQYTVIGNNGWVQASDAATLEPAASALICEWKGYIDPTISSNLTIKEGGYGLYVSGGLLYGYAISNAASTEILYPNAAGDLTGIASANPAVAHYLNVDDLSTAPDDLTTEVNTAAVAYEYDLYNITDTFISTNSYISSLSAYYRTYNAAASADLTPRLKLSGITLDGAEWSNGGLAWASSSQAMSRPGGGYWSISDLNSLQLGMGLKAPGGTTRCTQIYISISFYPATTTSPVTVTSGYHTIQLRKSGHGLDIYVDGVVSPAWYNASWTERQELTCYGSSSGVQTDYQKLVRVYKGAGTSTAGNIAQYTTGDDTLSGEYYTNTWIAQTFTAESTGTLTSALLKLARTGAPAAAYTCAIRAVDGAGLPVGANIASGTVIDGGYISTTASWYEFNLGAGVAITKGVKYAVLLYSAGGGAGNALKVRYDNASSPYTGGGLYNSVNAGVTWSSAGADTDAVFQILSNPSSLYCGGNCLDNFDDLRFTKADGVTKLDHWVEFYVAGSYANVWVELDTIAQMTSLSEHSHYYMYYGNPVAPSVSSIEDTFIFGDDFDSYALGSDMNGQGGWTDAAVVTVSNEQAYSGTQSAKGVGGAVWRLSRALAATSQTYYVGYKLYKETAANLYIFLRGDASSREQIYCDAAEAISFIDLAGAPVASGLSIIADSWRRLSIYNEIFEGASGGSLVIMYESSPAAAVIVQQDNTGSFQDVFTTGDNGTAATQDSYIDDYFIAKFAVSQPLWGTPIQAPATIYNSSGAFRLDSGPARSTEYTTVTIGGVDKLHWHPTNMPTNTLTDTTGNGNTGTINWGSNPAAMEITVGGVLSPTSYVPPSSNVSSAPLVLIPPTNTTSFGGTYIPGSAGNLYENVSETGSKMPQYPLFVTAAAALDWTVPTLYGVMMFITSIVMGIAFFIGTGSLTWGVIALGGTFEVAASTGIIGFWIPLIVGLVCIMIVITLRGM